MIPAISGAALAGVPDEGAASLGRSGGDVEAKPAPAACDHCGEPCDRTRIEAEGKTFCCVGCRTVFSLLREAGLGEYYRLGERPGRRLDRLPTPERWAYLDEAEVAAKLLEYRDAKMARVTFQVPAIHCVACVWLLENLFRLHPGIGRSRVHFGRREVAITYSPEKARLGEVAALLESVGYAPELTLAELNRPAAGPVRKLGLRVAVAGFAFGNIMLFSLPQYLGLDAWSGPLFRGIFGWLSLALALPAVVFSAADYWRSAWASLRQRMLTLDVPIAAGIAAIYGQSVWEILSVRGEGYLDSLTGLIFFLLCGRAFQQKTHDRLGFDRDYRGFFPLAVIRKTAKGEETVSISSLEVGDRLVVRHGELIPADATLAAGEALIDYSFVTGESEAMGRGVGEHLYAGGRQVGGAIEVETVKPVSQSYLTSLWNDEAFRKQRDNAFETLTNRYSRRFTWIVLWLAVGSLVGWSAVGEGARGLKAFVSVLIVACPCALALAAPFTLGTAQRLLGRRDVYLRNAQVLEAMAEVGTVVFDKTGTLTASEAPGTRFHGAAWTEAEAAAVAGVCGQSAHPYARHVARSLGGRGGVAVEGFREETGRGILGRVGDLEVIAGSKEWMEERGIGTGASPELPKGGTVHVALGGRWRGVFVVENRLRPEVDRLLAGLATRYELALLSGDNARERDRFAGLFGAGARLHFNSSPREKLGFVRGLQAEDRRVMMVGDGLNDAGALRQANVGVAVVDGVGKFSPASDVIMDAGQVPRLGQVLAFARRTVRLVRTGFAVSGAYNVVGVAIAAAGVLSPIVCAILMPLSSVTVVLLAVGATHWAARRSGLTGKPRPRPAT